jgi:hypothetical protein
MANIDKYQIFSDVHNRDGIGMEFFSEGRSIVEIFRDDKLETRTVTLFKDGISLEMMEQCIDIFKRNIPWTFNVQNVSDYVYFKFSMSVPLEKNQNYNDDRYSLVSKILGCALQKVIPRANPEFDPKLGEVQTWFIEYDSNADYVNREVGVDRNSKVIVKLPLRNNYGYWLDTDLKLDDYKKNFTVEDITPSLFQNLWEQNDI